MIATSRAAVDWIISGALLISLGAFVAACEVRYRRTRRFWSGPWIGPRRSGRG